MAVIMAQHLGTIPAIVRTLQRVARDRTVVAVTHRLDSIAGADRVIVMEGGRIVVPLPTL